MGDPHGRTHRTAASLIAPVPPSPTIFAMPTFSPCCPPSPHTTPRLQGQHVPHLEGPHSLQSARRPGRRRRRTGPAHHRILLQRLSGCSGGGGGCSTGGCNGAGGWSWRRRQGVGCNGLGGGGGGTGASGGGSWGGGGGGGQIAACAALQEQRSAEMAVKEEAMGAVLGSLGRVGCGQVCVGGGQRQHPWLRWWRRRSDWVEEEVEEVVEGEVQRATRGRSWTVELRRHRGATTAAGSACVVDGRMGERGSARPRS